MDSKSGTGWSPGSAPSSVPLTRTPASSASQMTARESAPDSAPEMTNQRMASGGYVALSDATVRSVSSSRVVGDDAASGSALGEATSPDPTASGAPALSSVSA